MRTLQTATLILGVVTTMLFSPAIARGQSEPPPLPLHGVEGYTGVFATYTAYMANPPKDGTGFGVPSMEGIFVHMGHGRNLKAITFTQMYGDRFEYGLAVNRFDMSDLPQAINNALGIQITDDDVTVVNINARCMLLKEGKNRPAVTLGVHYKTNSEIGNIDRELGGAMMGVGIVEDQGWDYTLYATKMFPSKHPTMVSLGLRSSEAAHLGLLGFTNNRDLTLEGNVCVMATDRLVLAVEYRSKPNKYTPIPGLIAAEDDWWTLCAAYIVNDNFTIGAGYGHFGNVLNHKANSSWGVKAKYEW